jgi:hypothetical protein
LIASSSTISSGAGEAAGVLLHDPSLLLEDLGVLLGGESPDALGGVLEAGIVAVDHDLGHQRRDLLGDPALLELVEERERDHIADRSLGVRPDDVERGEVHLGGCQLVPAQDETDLRAVAVGDHDVPSLLDLLDRVHLRTDVLVLLIADE